MKSEHLMRTSHYFLGLTLLSTAACGDDGGTDTDTGTTADTGSDTQADVGADTTADVFEDVAEDTVEDVQVDAAPDAQQDTTPDADPEDTGDTGEVEPTEPLVSFHAVHLAEGVGVVDVFTSLVSSPFHSDLPFGESSGVTTAVGGDAAVVFRSQDSDYEVTVRGELAFGGSDQWTAGAIGNADSPTAVVFREDSSAPPNDAVRYRYIHASTSLPNSVNLWLANEGEPDDTFIEDLGFGDISDDATRAAGAHRISIDLEKDGTPDVFFDMGDLVSTAQYTFWISADDAGSFILITDTEGGSSRIDGSPIE